MLDGGDTGEGFQATVLLISTAHRKVCVERRWMRLGGHTGILLGPEAINTGTDGVVGSVLNPCRLAEPDPCLCGLRLRLIKRCGFGVG